MAATLRSAMFALALGHSWQHIKLLPLHTTVYCFTDSDFSILAILRPTANPKHSSYSAQTANVLVTPRLRNFADVQSSARRVLIADSFLFSLSACWEKLIRFT